MRKFYPVWVCICSSLCISLVIVGIMIHNLSPAEPEPDWERMANFWGEIKDIVGDIPSTIPTSSLFDAICIVESGNDNKAYNAAEEAAGPAQIRPIALEDYNRIRLLIHPSPPCYNLEDRYSRVVSKVVFEIYTTYWMKHAGIEGNEAAARIWNGGPKGYKKESTKSYWEKVKREMS